MIDLDTDWVNLAWQRLAPAVPSPEDPFLGSAWQLREAFVAGDGIRPVRPGAQAILTLDAGEYRFTAYSCETYAGPYRRDGGSISFTVEPSRHMGCGRFTETRYVENLSKVASYLLRDGTLTLLDASGRWLLVFEPFRGELGPSPRPEPSPSEAAPQQ
jgi:heat shock protein HslJ